MKGNKMSDVKESEAYKKVLKSFQQIDKKNTTGDKFIVGTFAFILALGLMIPVYMLCGTIGADLWAWFITPIFGIVIGKAQFVGILLVINFITNCGNIRGTNDVIDNLGPVNKVIALNISICFSALIIWGMGAFIATYAL
jgi:hypothetical protein